MTDREQVPSKELAGLLTCAREPSLTNASFRWAHIKLMADEIERLQAARDECERQYQEKVDEVARLTHEPPDEWQPIETAPKSGRFQVCLASCPHLSWPAHSDNGELWSNAHGPLNRMVQGRVTKATHWRPAHSPPTKEGEQP